MTTGTRDHPAILRGITEQLRQVLEGSPQGIYIYLDDEHKACNQRFAEMLGYTSPAEWDRRGSFTELFVDGASQHRLVGSYAAAMEQQVASTIDVTWRRKDGSPQASSVQLVPIAFGNELLALHFVTAR